jgi:truncated hemoglobin YjbI
MSEQSLFDELGGEPALRRVIDRFVDRMFDDVMIGYLFRRADRERVKQKELEHAAAHLGGPLVYTGRPLDAAHRPHQIRGGQFMRRVRILEETLTELGVPEAVRKHWIEHTLSLQALVTNDVGGVCDPTGPGRP